MSKHLIHLIFILYSLFLSKSNYILTVISTSYSVNTPANLTITIRTTTIINALDIVLSNSFVISNPICSVNATATPCNRIVPSTGTNLFVRFSYNFQNNTNYTLVFNLSNPPYADSFSVQGYVGSTSFLNSGPLIINPYSINCSMQSSSSVVNQLANTTFNIGVKTLSSGTIGSISIQVNSQEIYQNLINSSPTCSSENFQYSCSLGTVFGVQVLTINSINVGARVNNTALPVLINSIRNPPYNATFVNIMLIIGKFYHSHSRLSRKKYLNLYTTATCTNYLAVKFFFSGARLGFISRTNIECIIFTNALFSTIRWSNN